MIENPKGQAEPATLELVTSHAHLQCYPSGTCSPSTPCSPAYCNPNYERCNPKCSPDTCGPNCNPNVSSDDEMCSPKYCEPTCKPSYRDDYDDDDDDE